MAPTIHLRGDAVTRLSEILGCDTRVELAQVLGFDVSQLSRLYNRRSNPGTSFIARVLLATEGEATFDDLFEVVRTADSSRTWRCRGGRTHRFGDICTHATAVAMRKAS